MTYDAILILSFGGPERREDVIPFLENVLFARTSPARAWSRWPNTTTISAAAARSTIRTGRWWRRSKASSKPGPRAVYRGNRNWHPLLPDTLRQMQAEGASVRLALPLRPSAPTPAAANTGRTSKARAPKWGRMRRKSISCAPSTTIQRSSRRRRTASGTQWSGFRRSAGKPPAWSSPPTACRARWRRPAQYVAQLEEAAGLVCERLGLPPAPLVYQSRSGPPSQPWLEPDIGDHIRRLDAREGVADLVVMPLGFLSDHMEVVYDLDTEAAALCRELGMTLYRAATVGVHPSFISMIRQLILERTEGGVRRASGMLGPGCDFCAAECCRVG